MQTALYINLFVFVTPNVCNAERRLFFASRYSPLIITALRALPSSDDLRATGRPLLVPLIHLRVVISDLLRHHLRFLSLVARGDDRHRHRDSRKRDDRFEPRLLCSCICIDETKTRQVCNFSHLDTAPSLRSRSLAARIEIAIGQRADKDERPGAVICCVARAAVCVICPGFFGSCIVGRDLFFSSGVYVASVYFVPSVNDGQ